MPYEFDQAAVAYSEARSQCQVATDDALDTAQDLEAVAVEGLINTPSEWPWAVFRPRAILASNSVLIKPVNGHRLKVLCGVERIVGGDLAL